MVWKEEVQGTRKAAPLATRAQAHIHAQGTAYVRAHGAQRSTAGHVYTSCTPRLPSWPSLERRLTRWGAALATGLLLAPLPSRADHPPREGDWMGEERAAVGVLASATPVPRASGVLGVGLPRTGGGLVTAPLSPEACVGGDG